MTDTDGVWVIQTGCGCCGMSCEQGQVISAYAYLSHALEGWETYLASLQYDWQKPSEARIWWVKYGAEPDAEVLFSIKPDGGYWVQTAAGKTKRRKTEGATA